jgi:hypothetical protein
VTADSDFYELATTIGPPPKVVWLGRWTHPTRDGEMVLRRGMLSGSRNLPPIPNSRFSFLTAIEVTVAGRWEVTSRLIVPNPTNAELPTIRTDNRLEVFSFADILPTLQLQNRHHSSRDAAVTIRRQRSTTPSRALIPNQVLASQRAENVVGAVGINPFVNQTN